MLKKMENIVKKYVKHFKSDFYDYDVLTIGRCYPNQVLIWIVRNCGTYLVANCKHLKERSEESQAVSMAIFEYYENDPEIRFYEVITGKSVIKISNKKAREILTA